MTPYDIAMIAVILVGMAWGAWKGITWQLAGIASLVLGYVVAFPLSAQLAPKLPGEPLVARGAALLACYVAVSLGVFLVAWSIRSTLRRLRFEAYDRHLGMMLGGLEGLIVGLVVTIVVLSVAPGSRASILASPTGKLVHRGLEAARPAVPAELREKLEPVWDAIDGAPTRVARGRDAAAEELAGSISDELEDRGADLGRRAGERIGRALDPSDEDGRGRTGTARRW